MVNSNKSNEISLQEALLYMTSPRTLSFEITFIRAQGDRQGEEKTVKKARYGAHRDPYERAAQIQNQRSRNTNKALHKDSLTLPMHDRDNLEDGKKGYFSPKISHIIKLNGLKIIR